MYNKSYMDKIRYVLPVHWIWDWNIFWWKIEGREIRNGINVYHPDDPDSAGFVIKIGKFGFRVRYSKRAKQWFIGLQKYSFENTWLPFNWDLDFTIKKELPPGWKRNDDA